MPTLRPWLSSLYDDMHRPLGTNVSINPTSWRGIGSHLDEELRFTTSPPGTAISTGAKLLSARHVDLNTKADLVKVPVRFPSGRTIWFSQLFEVQQFTALGIPVQSDANLDISSYETLAQCFVLLAFWKCSGAGRLALKLPALSDNSGAEAVCNKLYTSKTLLNLFVRKLCMWSALSGISLECSHIAGEKKRRRGLPFTLEWRCLHFAQPLSHGGQIRDRSACFLECRIFRFDFSATGQAFVEAPGCLHAWPNFYKAKQTALAFPLLAFFSGQYRVAASFGLPGSSPGFS